MPIPNPKPEEPKVVTRTAEEMNFAEENTGEISGYALTWNYFGDGFQFLPGAFLKSIRERMGKIPLLVRHFVEQSSVLSTVGWIVKAVEDEIGLFISAKFDADPFSQQIRQKAQVKGVRGLSTQARPLRYEVKDGLIVSSEAELLEVTLTNMPADLNAGVVSVRETPSAPPAKDAADTSQPTPSAPPAKDAADTSEDSCRREATILLRERENKCLEQNC